MNISELTRMFRSRFFILVISILLLGTIILLFFAGIGWAALILYLAGLTIKITPRDSWLDKHILGNIKAYSSKPNNSSNIGKIIYWILQVVLNLFWLVIVIMCFKANVRLIDLFS